MPEYPQRILVVDDEPSVRDLASQALVSSGFECDVAADGAQAEQSLCEKSYDGVVTDLRMPHCHGHALCELLLRSHNPPEIMVLTGLDDARLARDLLNRGVYEFVQKPIDFDLLAQKVRLMVGGTGNPPREARGLLETTGRSEPSNLLRDIEIELVDLKSRVGDRLDNVVEPDEDISDPPPSIRSYIERLTQSEAAIPGHQARQCDRASCFTFAIATPIDRNWKPTEASFKVALRDVSTSGVRLLHTRATNAEYLALRWDATQLESKEIRVVAQLRRCAPLRCFYELGGQFLMVD